LKRWGQVATQKGEGKKEEPFWAYHGDMQTQGIYAEKKDDPAGGNPGTRNLR